jgi:hypothetical protein
MNGNRNDDEEILVYFKPLPKYLPEETGKSQITSPGWLSNWVAFNCKAGMLTGLPRAKVSCRTREINNNECVSFEYSFVMSYAFAIEVMLKVDKIRKLIILRII